MRQCAVVMVFPSLSVAQSDAIMAAGQQGYQRFSGGGCIGLGRLSTASDFRGVDTYQAHMTPIPEYDGVAIDDMGNARSRIYASVWTIIGAGWMENKKGAYNERPGNPSSRNHLHIP